MNGPPTKEWAALAGTALKIQADRQASENTNTELGNFHQLSVAVGDVLAGVGLPLSEVEETYLDTPPAVLSGPIWAGLYDLGVTGRGLNGEGRCGGLGVDDVTFLPGGKFEFCRMGRFTNNVTAIIIPCTDEDGTLIDLCAWSHKTGRIALWRGAAPALGLENISALRLDGPLVAHSTVLDWLRAGRHGIFVINHALAAQRLAGVTLRVHDAAFGRRLLDELTIEPRVVLQRRRAA